VLDLTRLTVAEFREVVPPCEAACQAPLTAWRLDGRPRTARRYTTNLNGPVPTPEDRRLVILVDRKTSPLHVVHGRLFGMGQSTAHQGLHVLLVVLRATLRVRGEAPPWSGQALAPRLGGAEADAAAVVVPPPASPLPPEPSAGEPAAPRCATTAPRGASIAPQNAPAPTRGDRGTKKGLTVQNGLWIQAARLIRVWSDPSAGSRHDKRMADAPPDPWPAGSRLRQDRGVLALTLPQLAVSMPTRKPRGRALTRTQNAANRRIARRHVRLEPVHRRVKRGRMVHDTCRLRKAGVRELLIDVCCGLHPFRVRRTPWQRMGYSR
jgi:hypothetical protein